MESTALACLGNIFVDPKKALQDVLPHGRWAWYPLIIMILAGIAFTVWYFSTVDMGWLANQTVATMSGKYSSDQLDTIRQGFTRGRFLTFGIVGTSLAVVIILLLQALYFFFVAKISGYEPQTYGKWLSFSIWTSFPNVVATIAAAVAYGFANAQTSYYAVDVTSLNTLLFRLPLSHPLAGVAGSVHLTTFWCLALMIVGLSLWSKKSLGKSSLIVLAPWVLIYAVWIIVKLV
ncbi:MAG: YIP1 family protein [Gammaproteobacteria bacterium]